AQMSRSELTKDVGQQLIAKGRGYLAFATDNPALFDLMFGSNQPDYTNPDLGDAADAALAPLVDSIVATTGGSPFGGGVPTRELVAGWALVHGLAGLLNHRKLRWAQDEEGGYEALIESVLSTRLTIR
ncbi:MAG: TetR-like C-terminal domain-containing protein, partial [Pseudomonadota bacterium]